MIRSQFLTIFILLLAPTLRADDSFFEAKVRPVFMKHCYECHAGDTDEGGLQLDSKAATRAGGNRGPAVVPGKPEESWLLKAITHEDPDLAMPPKQKKLPAAVIADLKNWIKTGAHDPRVGKPRTKKVYTKADRDFWSLQPPKLVEPAESKNKTWRRNKIDDYILAKLQASSLPPSSDAKPNVLLRRLYFDLIGLPPSATELAQFETAVKKQGYDWALGATVDELFARPQFGERWGRHWLDVARFGESSGNEANISFPYAWRYRDYVIDAYNHDLPFERFLTEQIAGDLLPYESPKQRSRLLIATGYLAIGPKNLDEANKKQFEADLIDEQIDAVSRGVIANSLACARCHDHKFDPFSMEDYYAMAGIFASTKTFFGTAVSPANRLAGDPLELPAEANEPIFHKSIPAEKVTELKKQLADLRAEKPETLRDALRILWVGGGIEGRLEKVSPTGAALPLAMGTLDRKEPTDAWLLIRGEVNHPDASVPRGFPAVLPISSDLTIPPESSGRLQLAKWLTHPDQPLTNRVYVNRIWRQLFGAGIVATVDNFGATGELPSHPALLDFLAIEFQNEGQSTKQLIRKIVLSRTYRQASDFRKAAFVADPDNRLLWRASKRRLQAEAIRDAMLAASGELKTTRPKASLVGKVIGDKPIALIGLDKRLPKDLDGSLHRSVYLPIIRDRLPDILDLFDFADPSRVFGDRETTNVPTQAHYLMNSSFVQSRSAAFAKRLTREETTVPRQVRLAFLLCFAREPDFTELAHSLEFLTAESTNAEEQLARFCQALFAAAEFRNVE